ncbi:MAG: hypothetical protein JWO87_2842, partial [Phycisphaerales bacterium]|nr:hypothetical protein [Phycisphaerales bacterium]
MRCGRRGKEMKPRKPGKRALLFLTAIFAVSLTAVFNFRHATGSNTGYESVELNALGYFP